MFELKRGKLTDFEEWYASQAGDALRPAKMVLVGLGLDMSAYRMVAHLAEKGIEISLLTFHGYIHGDGHVVFARRIDRDEQCDDQPAA